MITGQVRGREAVIPLSVRRPGGHWVQLEAVVDTGFTEFIILPPSEIASLALPYRTDMPMVLGDGAVVSMRVFTVVVSWDGTEITIPVQESGGGTLVGMSLLHGHDVHLQVGDGGPVSISRSP
jgi:clan AA aspartic protease